MQADGTFQNFIFQTLRQSRKNALYKDGLKGGPVLLSNSQAVAEISRNLGPAFYAISVVNWQRPSAFLEDKMYVFISEENGSALKINY